MIYKVTGLKADMQVISVEANSITEAQAKAKLIAFPDTEPKTIEVEVKKTIKKKS